MDFLDPRKRRAYHIRLIVGYVLVAIVISLATVIIVYGANGYGINTKTGQIVQNGLLFVDSKPGGAEIFLNGKDRGTTSARLIVPAGKYTLTLKKAGYRDWTRQFTLNEQSIGRYVYPFLFPLKPTVINLKTYSVAPALMTETPDRHWLLVQANSGSGQLPTFDEYDTSTLDQKTPDVRQVAMPAGLLTNFTATSKLTEIEWSTDNDHLLLRHDYAGGSEYIIFDRANPDQSINVNQLFGITPAQVNLFNKKADQLYVLSQPGGVLQLGDTGSGQLAAAVLNDVLVFKPYGKDLITYVTADGQPAGQVAARIWENGRNYPLYEFKAGSHYLIDAAQYNDHFYYVAGSDTADRVNVYKDPLDDIKNPKFGKAIPVLALHDPGATKAGFSDNARFIGLENGRHFAVYDIETGNNYEYQLKESLVNDMDWMDGHRLIGDSAGQILVMDYDGVNRQLLGTTSYPAGGLFSRDYNHMLTIAPAADGTSIVLKDTDLRAGADLPKR